MSPVNPFVQLRFLRTSSTIPNVEDFETAAPPPFFPEDKPPVAICGRHDGPDGAVPPQWELDHLRLCMMMWLFESAGGSRPIDARHRRNHRGTH